jgi:hypothetical protein
LAQRLQSVLQHLALIQGFLDRGPDPGLILGMDQICVGAARAVDQVAGPVPGHGGASIADGFDRSPGVVRAAIDHSRQIGQQRGELPLALPQLGDQLRFGFLLVQHELRLPVTANGADDPESVRHLLAGVTAEGKRA